MVDRKPLANAYAQMMDSPAWKDLEKWAMDESDRSMKAQDAKPAVEMIINEVCEERGYRNGLRRLIQHASQRKEGI